MSLQIAVRLPDDLAAFVDDEVKAGRAPSRAAVISRALERERRRELERRDIEILTLRSEDDDVLDALAAHTASRPIDVD